MAEMRKGMIDRGGDIFEGINKGAVEVEYKKLDRFHAQGDIFCYKEVMPRYLLGFS